MMKSRIHLDKKEYDVALSEIDLALGKSPEDSRAWEQRKIILRALGREEEAQAAEERIQILAKSSMDNRFV